MIDLQSRLSELSPEKRRLLELLLKEQQAAAPKAVPLMKRMVASGRLGRKSGRGFYDYSQDPPAPVAGLV